jgi:hypothetical protein
MAKSEKSRKVIALSAGVALGLSATSIVLLQSKETPNERLKVIQSALRDGASKKTTVKQDAPLIRLSAAER